MSANLFINYKKLRAALLIMIFSSVWITAVGNITPPYKLKAIQNSQIGIPGDADGNGIVNMEDARLIVRYITGQISSLPFPENADANQDDEITIDDAYIIAQRVSGKSRIVIVGPKNGFPGKAEVGTLVRIEVFEKFYPYMVINGTVRILSQSTGYDSGDQPLTFERDGRSLYYNWETDGLTPASDYNIDISITESKLLSADEKLVLKDADNQIRGGDTITLESPIFEMPQLHQVLEAYAPSPGFALTFTRTFHSNHEFVPYLGPLGRGWWHNFDIHLIEETDGSVTFLNEIGNGRLFTNNPDGTYTPSPGDYAELSRDPSGAFFLKEKNGFIYAFRPDLLFDYMEDLSGNKIFAIYNTNKKLIEVQHSCGSSFQFEYNSDGRVSKLIDNLGRETTYTYDGYGTHLINVIVPGNRKTVYTFYLGQGEETDHRLESITFPDTTHQFFSYDAFGRISTKEGSWGTGKINYSYDTDGITYITDSLGNVITIKSNSKSQPTEIINPLGYSTHYSYDDNFNLTDIIDPSGNSYHFEYDNSGNQTGYIDPAGNEINMTYETAFNALSVLVDSRGYITTFAYNSNGNLILITYPDGSTESFDYEDNGSLISNTDRKGNMILCSNNAQGQLLSKQYPDATTADYTYDASGNITSATNYTGTINFAYDELNRLIKVTYPGNRIFQYQYNSTSKRNQMIDPDGRVLNYNYDVAGRLFQLTNAIGEVIVEYWYDASDRRAGKGLINGIHAIYEYDAVGQLLQVNYFNDDDSLVSFFYYTYDASGNKLSKESIDGKEFYNYDELNQLTHVTYPDGKTEQFIYDEMGNRQTVIENNVSVNYITNNLNQYESFGATNFNFDNNGNLILKELDGQLTHYYYDFENRLTRVETPTDTVDFSYNPFNIRNSQTRDGEFIKFLWDGDAIALEENTSYQTLASYTWGGNLDEVIKMERNNSSYFYLQDAILSTSDIFDNEGSLIEHYTYKAFGEPQSTSEIGNPWYFTGLSYDFELKLQYNRLRFYNPRLGRFISCDPINIAGGINLYSYVLNQPINYIDPIGLSLIGHKLDWVGKTFKLNWCGEHTSGGTHIEHGGIGDWNVLPVNWFDYHCRSHDFDFKRYGGLVANTLVVARVITEFWLRRTIGDWAIDKLDNRKYGPYVFPTGGGTKCPTFIQLPIEKGLLKSDSVLQKSSISQILGNINVPSRNCLLRSDIPIFGIVGGKKFKSYQIEYGNGFNPYKWQLIESSQIPKNENDIGYNEMQHMQGDIDIHGNLATWNVGLKNWSHLPWHAPEDTIDLNGIYTIKLTVEGENGETVEDRVTCEVGRVIAQCLPGIAVSPDEKVTMNFPEQALTHPFRIYTILTIEEAGVVKLLPPENAEYIGDVYRIREPGDRFIKNVTLEFSVIKYELSGRKPENIAIVQYDVSDKNWKWVPTQFNISGKEGKFSTELSELPKTRAVYALAYDSEKNNRSEIEPEKLITYSDLAPVSQEVLVNNTFEEGFGSWSLRDKYVGAVLARDDKTTPDSSYALKITNDFQGGNFSVTAFDQQFDVKDYPIMSFDYRVGPGVKTDFYLLVNNRWYNLGFTDDPVDFRNQDVNIANLSRFENVFSDNNWHSVSINLYELLRTKTKHTQVDAIIMADWNVGGYMKLDFGNNARGATYYIDNFKLSAGPEYDMPNHLIIDNFNTNQSTNMLGGATGTFSNAGTNYLQAIIEDNNKDQNQKDRKTGNNGVLKLTFDASQENAYCGYWTSLQAVDLTDMSEISFQLLSSGDIPTMLLGLRHAKQTVESAVSIQNYLTEPDAEGWYTVSIPLSAFIGNGLPDLTCMDVLFIKFENRIYSGKGTVFIDDLQFIKESNCAVVSNFNNISAKKNQFGGDYRINQNGAVAISVDHYNDTETSEENTLRISYGGNIGLSYGGRHFSYATWESDLLGFNASNYKNLVLRIKGQKGGEQPNIYLADAATRRCIRAKELSEISTSWQEMRIPLQKYVDQGIDLTHLETLQITFEWEEMSGTIYIDEIYFED